MMWTMDDKLQRRTNDSGAPRNNVLNTLLTDKTKSGEWNMKYFKSLTSFENKIKYINDNLVKIGVGSSRIVYKIDDDTVLKIAKNEKGLNQNDLESDISSTDCYEFVSKVYNTDPNNMWIESEYAKKMKQSDFKKLTGFSFKDFATTLLAEYSRIVGRGGAYYEVSDDYDEILESDLLQGMLSFINDYKLMPGDFAKINSWGIVNRDGLDSPILIDYGISKEDFLTLYNK